ncbi:hypothetical protein [Sphingomonas glaciei]|uniref:VanZ family protein n=1 Tax=Sphingomonas glaciei TaxID=2938948 RepID=A0ABY5MVB9_9SPHN|nr:hypothetical protein [Sphingomonas glaciei]UUR08428.1 hypothetical protein M1K48_01920 [Sphingomonas glaciei]
MSFDPAVWFHVKELVRHATGWPMDTLHVMGGVILQMVLAALLRTSLASKWPWLIVLGMELTNEAYDLWFERWPSLGLQVGEGLRDLVGTMLLPTLLLWAARCRPRLMSGRGR